MKKITSTIFACLLALNTVTIAMFFDESDSSTSDSDNEMILEPLADGGAVSNTAANTLNSNNDTPQENYGWGITHFFKSQYDGAARLLRFGRSAATDLASAAQHTALYHPTNIELLMAFRENGTVYPSEVEEFRRLLAKPSADITYTFWWLGPSIWQMAYDQPEDHQLRVAILEREELMRRQGVFTPHHEFCRAILRQDVDAVRNLLLVKSSEINGPLCPLLLAVFSKRKSNTETGEAPHCTILTLLLDSPDLDITKCKDLLLSSSFMYTDSTDLLKVLLDNKRASNPPLDVNARRKFVGELRRLESFLDNLNNRSLTELLRGTLGIIPMASAASTNLQIAIALNKLEAAGVLASDPEVDPTIPNSLGMITPFEAKALNQHYLDSMKGHIQNRNRRDENSNLRLILNLAEKGALICVTDKKRGRYERDIERSPVLFRLLSACDGGVFERCDLDDLTNDGVMPALFPQETLDDNSRKLDWVDIRCYIHFALYNWALIGDNFISLVVNGCKQTPRFAPARMGSVINYFRNQFIRKHGGAALTETDPKAQVKAFLLELMDRYQISINDPDAFGFTPLMWAAARGRIDLVSFILTLPGIDVNSAANERGHTALHIAALNGQPEVVRFLLGCDEVIIDQKTSEAQGITALTLAKRRAHAVEQVSAQQRAEMIKPERFAQVVECFAELHRRRRALYLALSAPTHLLPPDIRRVLAKRLHLSQVDERGAEVTHQQLDENNDLMVRELNFIGG